MPLKGAIIKSSPWRALIGDKGKLDEGKQQDPRGISSEGEDTKDQQQGQNTKGKGSQVKSPRQEAQAI